MGNLVPFPQADDFIIGVDLSLTSTGYVVLNDDLEVCEEGAIKPDKLRGAARLSYIRDALQQVDYMVEPTLWVIEGYAYGVRKGSMLADMGELGGVVRLMLHDLYVQVPYLIVPPTKLKKFVTGKGNTKKDEMRLHVYKRWGFEHDCLDVIDAYGLARIGAGVLGLDSNLTQAQQKIVEEVSG